MNIEKKYCTLCFLYLNFKCDLIIIEFSFHNFLDTCDFFFSYCYTKLCIHFYFISDNN